MASSRALDKLKASKNAALGRIRRIKDNSEDLTNKGLGVAAGFAGAKYYGKWLAGRIKGGKPTQVAKLNMSYGRVGAGALIAYGMFGEDDRMSMGSLLAGAALLGADEGISSYVAELAAAPVAGA